MTSFKERIKSYISLMIKGKISYDRPGLKPRQDWEVILTTSFIILICIGIFAFYFYIGILQGKFFVVNADDEASRAKINSVLIDKVVGDMNNRASYSGDLKNGKYSLSDPSV